MTTKVGERAEGNIFPLTIQAAKQKKLNFYLKDLGCILKERLQKYFFVKNNEGQVVQVLYHHFNTAAYLENDVAEHGDPHQVLPQHLINPEMVKMNTFSRRKSVLFGKTAPQ